MSELPGRLHEAVAGAGYTAGWAIAGRLPTGVVARVFDLGADLATRRNGPGVQRLRANLARVRPGADRAELDLLVGRAMRSYARYWREAFALPALDPDVLHAAMHPHAHGIAASLEPLGRGRGVLYALPHAGNWDVAGVYLVRELARRGLDPVITTVVQRLRPESLFRRFLAYRRALGFEVVTADDPRTAHRALTARLRAGGVVCLVADRDLSGRGIDVSFLGAPARLPAGPARLARITGAALHPAYPVFVGEAWGVRVGAEIPVPDERSRCSDAKAVQALADAFGELIAERPEDWHMLQPIGAAA
ncbi:MULTISPECIES: phosphatidylinositol mannoside acyltransferase [Pseudonocardia]|uniref:Phosphatidylinositol mannoside acyltransferase n=2 Tax=Pseudonocardia TaxID=1847 RepID=A0A1Y2N3P1_PSEAH|nr:MULTISPECIES: phosphatidylinositol mannoside acyltransferase [Pseudonocardia]OSY41769.1 Phosphatidylinositol mannoside acyltransferase [Pseudonocardia autotrophica]TDN71179.1 KDO2-lipid IV(A) lauroyltransferase [Pseudonocardia autotrophica]BBG01849.1 lipid A biosynthesis lauroyl acyltransferase [Pseudonocardia autotrophica]GEC23015.1 lipid A biosynthesis lauroyl acyltransferase [Pseudonocardia saturnea]